MKKIFSIYSKLNPAQALVLGYLFYSIISAFILLQPFCHAKDIHFLDNFFTSVSAMSTTGLTTVNVATAYTFWGQLCILILIQIGAIGYMTFSSFIVLAITKKIPSYKKKILFSSFSFPTDFSLKEFLYNMIIFSVICECLGSIILCFLFKQKGVENYIWNGIFHSVSAFCTAGFSTLPNGLIPFAKDSSVVAIISILMLLGGVGFIVFSDIFRRFSRKNAKMTFTSKIIIVISTAFILIGTFIYFVLEEPVEKLSPYQELLCGIFQIISTCTTCGFTTVELSKLQNVTLVLFLFFMTFGASPSGTGGGIKNTTFAALYALVISTLKRQEKVVLLKNEIPEKRVQLATAIFSFYMFILLIGIFLMTYFENKPFINLTFEVFAALGNIGMSTGITDQLGPVAKILLMVLMFISRIGVLTFGFSLIPQDLTSAPALEKKDLII
ncbi:MAG: potassium transporter KtrB [Chlamydiae bacterium]|nr:potassium transporter KtrB [Chlamydiota bacterium]